MVYGFSVVIRKKLVCTAWLILLDGFDWNPFGIDKTDLPSITSYCDLKISERERQKK